MRIEKRGSEIGDGFLWPVIRERLLPLLEPMNAQVLLLLRIQPVNTEGEGKKYGRQQR